MWLEEILTEEQVSNLKMLAEDFIKEKVNEKKSIFSPSEATDYILGRLSGMISEKNKANIEAIIKALTEPSPYRDMHLPPLSPQEQAEKRVYSIFIGPWIPCVSKGVNEGELKIN